MNEAELRALQRAVWSAEAATGECPDAETLMAFADGELDEAQREVTALHLVACEPCVAIVRVAINAREWSSDLAADFEAPPAVAVESNVHYLPTAVGASSADLGAPLPQIRVRPARKRVRAAWPAAIAATLVGVIFFSLSMRQPPVPDALRGIAPVATVPQSGAVLSQAPAQLSWPCTAAPAAVSVEILGADALPRWRGEVVNCAVSLPAEIRSELPAGEYLWRLKNAAGDPVLGPVAFRITP